MTEARFGMFIHFGAYAVPARGEWVKTTERMSNEEYQKYVDVFNPVDCDMSEWARLAKEAGMKYAVMTAKHHDGFCLFDSNLTDYSTGKTIGRDLVREFLDAFRAEGLKVGLYYSLIDWHHPDYPKYKHPNHPMRDREEFRDEQIDWDNYLKYMHGQVEELTTRYGRLDVMWFDFSYGEMTGEKWQARKLVDMVSKNGNLLLNVGPDGRGNIPPQSIAILKEVGEWMKLNGESIYGCGNSGLEAPQWGRITQKENTFYLHWMYPKIGYLNMKGFADKAKVVTILSTGAEAFTAKEWWGNRHEDNFLINLHTPIYHTFPLPDPFSTVIKLEIKE